LAVLLAAGGAVTGKAKAPLRVVASFAALVAVGIVLDQLRARGKRIDERVTHLTRHARGINEKSGRLPLVREVSLPQWRVHRAVAQVPYVQRDKEAEAVEILTPGRPGTWSLDGRQDTHVRRAGPPALPRLARVRAGQRHGVE